MPETTPLFDALVNASVQLEIMSNINQRVAVGMTANVIPPEAAAEMLFQMEEVSQKLAEAYNSMAHMAALRVN